MERLKKIRPHDRAVEMLEWYIQENHLKPHAKLPGERELCELWNLNRSTLHSAIQELVEEHILYSEKGAGTFVAPPRLERNLQDGKSTTESMRSTGYFLWTEVLESRVEESDAYISKKLRIPAGSKVFYLRRLRMRGNTPLMIETSYINYEYCEGIESRSFSETSLYQILEGMGVAMDSGEESVSITYATQEEAKLLKVEPDQFLYYVSGHIDDREGNPIEFFKNVARSDQIRYTSVLKRNTAE